MREQVSKRFYAKIDWNGCVALPDEFLDRVEDVRNPVGAEVFVYVALKGREVTG